MRPFLIGSDESSRGRVPRFKRVYSSTSASIRSQSRLPSNLGKGPIKQISTKTVIKPLLTAVNRGPVFVIL